MTCVNIAKAGECYHAEQGYTILFVMQNRACDDCGINDNSKRNVPKFQIYVRILNV